MRVLLSTSGSRGEVQPVLALALQLRALGQEVRVCAPPNFRAWLEGFGLPVLPLEPEMPVKWDLSSAEGRRHAAEATVAAQFDTLPEAARGCAVLVGCGALQVGAASVAELAGIGYVHVHYCPASLPSPHHLPAPWPGWPRDEPGGARELWAADARRWNDTWGEALNTHRRAAGLAPVDDVRGHVLTGRSWLAADPALAPWPGGTDVLQTGAWLLPDERPLPAEVESFLQAGEPPVYFGLGSGRAPGEGFGRVMVDAARALGRRAIVSRGWAGLTPAEGTDCIGIGEANHRELLGRVAAVVHHGGAGTTTAAARAGAAQVVLPRQYDQHYWAGRVDRLGIGAVHPAGTWTMDSLATALRRALAPGVAARARAVATEVRADGARIAARHLMNAQSR